MAKKKTPRDSKPKTPQKKANLGVGKPDSSILARYSPTDMTNSHPDWIKTKFPEYITPHAGHEATAVREFTHDGHLVKIFTTYRVEVDGSPIRAHLSVDEDGRVFTHATPFVNYSSATDLMRSVIDAYPDSFSGLGGGHTEDHEHGGHQ